MRRISTIAVALLWALAPAIVSGQAIDVSPTHIDFGAVSIYGPYPTQTVTLSNTDPADLVVSAMALTDTVYFKLNESGGASPCGTTTPTLSSGASCTVTVSFQPPLPDARSAEFRIGSNDIYGKALFIVTLTGTAFEESGEPPSDDSGGGCLIAAVARGSYLAPYLGVLRTFRDTRLLRAPLGKALVDVYYAVSPSAAAALAASPPLKVAVRWTLTPTVYAIAYPRAAGLSALALLAVFAALAYRRRRRR